MSTIKQAFILILLSLSSFSVLAEEEPKMLHDQMLGSWVFTKMIYEDNELDPPNPDLRLTFTFFDNGTSRLYWDRKNVPGFCESFSAWTLNPENQAAAISTKLMLNTFALNPNNNGDCSKDPDMQLGQKPGVNIWIKDQRLFMVIMLADQDLTYVFNKIN